MSRTLQEHRTELNKNDKLRQLPIDSDCLVKTRQWQTTDHQWPRHWCITLLHWSAEHL